MAGAACDNRFCMFTKPARAVLAFCALAALSACGGGGERTNVPDTYKVKFETTKGDFVVEVQKSWAPLGADRFHELITSGFYNEARFFRIVPGFVVQFGLPADPAKLDTHQEFPDDPVKQSNSKGTLTFATRGPNSRTTQVFINLGNNARLDSMGFSPIGVVVEGMDVVEKLYSGYGEAPNQMQIRSSGNKYLESSFPNLDGIKSATVIE